MICNDFSLVVFTLYSFLVTHLYIWSVPHIDAFIHRWFPISRVRLVYSFLNYNISVVIDNNLSMIYVLLRGVPLFASITRKPGSCFVRDKVNNYLNVEGTTVLKKQQQTQTESQQPPWFWHALHPKAPKSTFTGINLTKFTIRRSQQGL